MKRPEHPYGKLEKRFRSYGKELPRKISHLAGDEFRNNILRRSGFESLEGVVTKWPGRKAPGVGGDRRLLIKTSRLLRSIQERPGIHVARVVASAPYARLMHQGGSIAITPKMRKFFWAMYYKHGGGRGRGNQTADFYKALALKKGKITIPARPYMVTSASLVRNLEMMVGNDLKHMIR